MEVIVNNKYKDRLFRMLFGTEENKDNILSLYNALNKTSYKDAGDIEIVTIDNVIYMGMRNDSSFIIECHIPLWEQQSTYNPNMPVRGFMYYGKLYDTYITQQSVSIYGTTPIKLPTPQYIVFYNGTADRPPIEKMRLSDSFMKETATGEYEWTATVYNLNRPENKPILDACKPLADYMEVVGRIRKKWKKTLSHEDAVRVVDEAIKSCIADGILAEFLTKHRAEVIDVTLTEFDQAKYEKTIFAEGEIKGEIKSACRLIKKGRITIAEAAEDIGMSVAEFEEAAGKYGFSY
ncbi:MAG: hypothetical protein K6E85_14185 [Lachnospiraceae bacterium]|nr:hypothetical protein [Lachnospiraceae bacterium]